MSIVAIVTLSWQGASAQEVGNWDLYPIFSGEKLQKIIDTQNVVYYLSDNWLYAYDKSNDETIYYTSINGLSDTGVDNIFYNYDKQILVVTYNNSNIDIIRSNGRVDNIPDLKNVIMAQEKGINSVDFQDNYAYLTTDFGYVVVDCDKAVIKESYNYGLKFTSMIATSQYIYATFSGKINVSEIGAKHYEISSFSATNITGNYELSKINDNGFVATTALKTYKITSDPKVLVATSIDGSACKSFSRFGNQFMAAYSGKYYLIDENLERTATVTLPEGVDGTYLSAYNGEGFWNLIKQGIREFSINDGTLTVLHDTYRPNTTSVDEPYYMQYAHGRLYSMNSGRNWIGTTTNLSPKLSCLQNGNWTNLIPNTLPTWSSSKYIEPYGMVVDNQDADAVWFGAFFEGVGCIKNGELIVKFTPENSPMKKNYVCCAPRLRIDSQGNLWVLNFNRLEPTYNQLFCLPANKKFDPTVTIEDWTCYNVGSLQMGYASEMCLVEEGGSVKYVLFADNIFKTKLVVIDVNNTPFDTSDDRQKIISNYVDQDGKSIDIGYIHRMEVDRDNRIWLGTNVGVSTINNVASVFTGELVFNHIKVPRNDGTNLADYLLDGIYVSAIAFDGSNRKWLGTTTSGVYLVSADGSEILKHFSKDNSDISDDLITGIACSTDDNKVFIGTKKGTFVYESDAMPSKSDYSNVYAYPNPVRPDYCGYITVAGLMENSLVKIADAMGNVIYSGKSTGGMFVWNGCNADGSRVNTGVYYVFASQNENEQSSGCVTKILVVK